MEYDVKGIEALLQQQSEIIPDKYDGSYELVRETIRSYSRMNSFADLDYNDLNLIYVLTVGTWRHSIVRKKENVSRSNLPDVEKVRLTALLDTVWNKAINHKYEHTEADSPNGSVGMFGTGFFSFQNKSTGQNIRDFIKMCVDIIDVDDDIQVYEIVEKVFSKGIKGMRAAAASMILHCLKPFTFPILNGNFGVSNIYEILNLKVRKVLELSSYIKNCRVIKSYRDKNYSFKNYRVFDVISFQLDSFEKKEQFSINVDELKKEIELYKNDFERIKEQERYKWQAIKTFQDNFDLSAKDFPSMLKEALKDHGNLLRQGNYYFAEGVINEIALHYPDYTCDMFRRLFDESQPLLDRMDQFSEDAKVYFSFKEGDSKAKNTYQDSKATSVYLFFKYPEKYSIYRPEKFLTVASVLGYKNLPKKAGEKVIAYFNLVDLVWNELVKDPELLALSKTRLNADCYDDSTYHVLAEDFMWFIYTTHRNKSEIEDDEFGPSLQEFDPALTKEQYEKVFAKCTRDSLYVLYYLKKLGGIGSCKQIATKFGNSAQSYNANAINIAKKVSEEYGVQTPFDEDSNQTYWPILFFGRYAKAGEEGVYVYKLRKTVTEAIQSLEDKGVFEIMAREVDYPKNMILYGPPGTGKTYHTVLYAVAIIEGKSIEELTQEINTSGYETVKERYDKYLHEAGQIAFTTFHQSYGYEEFIEGIKPLINEDDESGDIKYIIEKGVFAKFCEQATAKRSNKVDYGFNKYPVIWKVSLEKTGDNQVRSECMDKSHIRIGWDSYGENITDETDFSTDGGKVVLNAFINKMQIGDIVFSCYSASSIDAIGVITGDYEWHPEYDRFRRLRKVKWLVKGLNYNIVDINNGSPMTLSTVYKLSVSLSDVIRVLEENGVASDDQDNGTDKKYVFIIDEINRGNISKVFGELITLIEPGKRIGQREGLYATLPYSKKEFGIPNNVYIIGTMNTADRSIAIMDTALRRRFSFIEMLPDISLLEDIEEIEGINVAAMLKRINERINVLIDREHMIGHSYFMALKEMSTLECLSSIFENSIIPLLQEYFFDDYEKIRLVLGDNQKKEANAQFIRKNDNISSTLFGNTTEVNDLIVEYSVNKEAFNNPEAYKGIY